MNFSGVLLHSPEIGVCQPKVYGDIQIHHNMGSTLHILSAVKYKHHRKGQMRNCWKGMENWQCRNRSHWNPNDLTKKTSSKLNKDVISQKLYHSAYLTCSVQIIFTKIDGVYEIPLSTRNFSVGISVTFISPLEWVVHKCNNSRLEQSVWDWCVQCLKVMCLNWCCCTDIQLIQGWQQACGVFNNPHAVDSIATGFSVTVPNYPSLTVVNTLVSRHDKSFVVHLLEPEIKRCLKGTLCSFGVQYK